MKNINLIRTLLAIVCFFLSFGIFFRSHGIQQTSNGHIQIVTKGGTDRFWQVQPKPCGNGFMVARRVYQKNTKDYTVRECQMDKLAKRQEVSDLLARTNQIQSAERDSLVAIILFLLGLAFLLAPTSRKVVETKIVREPVLPVDEKRLIALITQHAPKPQPGMSAEEVSALIVNWMENHSRKYDGDIYRLTSGQKILEESYDHLEQRLRRLEAERLVAQQNGDLELYVQLTHEIEVLRQNRPSMIKTTAWWSYGIPWIAIPITLAVGLAGTALIIWAG